MQLHTIKETLQIVAYHQKMLQLSTFTLSEDVTSRNTLSKGIKRRYTPSGHITNSSTPSVVTHHQKDITSTVVSHRHIGWTITLGKLIDCKYSLVKAQHGKGVQIDQRPSCGLSTLIFLFSGCGSGVMEKASDACLLASK